MFALLPVKKILIRLFNLFTSLLFIKENSFVPALWENVPLFCSFNLISKATILSGISLIFGIYLNKEDQL